MKQGYTHLVFLKDRSGSMNSIKHDVIGGFNEFIETQKKEPGELTVTDVQFDDQDPYEVLNDFVPINKVTLLTDKTYTPRGGTPLNDALGKLIVNTGDKLGKLSDAERPEKVIVVIITDGEENSSHEYTTTRIREMIKHQEEVYSWKFIYIGANQDAFAVGANIGIGSTLSYTSDHVGTIAAFKASSKMSGKLRGMSQVLYCASTDLSRDLATDYQESVKEVEQEDEAKDTDQA